MKKMGYDILMPMETKNKTRQYTPLFGPIRMLIFQLPVEERLEIYREIQDKDWAKEFWRLHTNIGKKFRAAGLKAKDVPRLIKEVRREKNTSRT